MNRLKNITVSFCAILSITTHAQRSMENLDRGVAAVRTADGKIFVSWRLLGTEPNDLAFNLYCTSNGKTEKLNKGNGLARETCTLALAMSLAPA